MIIPITGGQERDGEIVLLVVLIFAGGGVAYFTWERLRPTEQKETVTKASQDQTPAPAPVSADTFTAAGYLEPVPPYPITVSALVAGRIDEFSLLEGTPIHAGQVVAKLDSAPLQLQLAELQAQNAVAEARLNQAQTSLERTQQLAPIGSVSTKDLDRAKADVAIAEAEQRQIAAAIARVGQHVDISLDAAPGKAYAGRVIRVLPRASLQKNTIQVKVSIPDPTPMFRPDMSVKITFHADHTQATAAKQ